jgi:hypothetical protein
MIHNLISWETYLSSYVIYIRCFINGKLSTYHIFYLMQNCVQNMKFIDLKYTFPCPFHTSSTSISFRFEGYRTTAVRLIRKVSVCICNSTVFFETGSVICFFCVNTVNNFSSNLYVQFCKYVLKRACSCQQSYAAAC